MMMACAKMFDSKQRKVSDPEWVDLGSIFFVFVTPPIIWTMLRVEWDRKGSWRTFSKGELAVW